MTKPTPILSDIPDIDDWSDCDGNSIYCKVMDTDKRLAWYWIDIADLHHYGRSDIVAEFFPSD